MANVIYRKLSAIHGPSINTYLEMSKSLAEMPVRDGESPDTNVSRRKTLSVIGTGGAVVTGLTGVPGTVVGSSGRTQRIVTLAQGEDAHQSVSVSKKWFNHKEQAIKIKEAIRNRFGGQEDVHTVGIGRGDRTIGDLRSKMVTVSVTPGAGDSTIDSIPSSLKGIPVAVERSERPKQTDCYTGSPDQGDGDSTRDVYGGLACYGVINAKEDLSEDATLCCRVYKDGKKYMLGCRHMLNGDNCDGDGATNQSWGRVNDNGNAENLGYAPTTYQKFDAALLNRSYTPKEFIYNISDESSGGIIGRVTGDGLDYLHSEAEFVRKRGRSTCATQGTIEKVRSDYEKCGLYTTEENQVVSTTKQEQGDSGGPVYYHQENGTNTDELYLVHIATRSDDGNARGSSANVMYNQENIVFGNYQYTGK
jgi:hypothetical protein